MIQVTFQVPENQYSLFTELATQLGIEQTTFNLPSLTDEQIIARTLASEDDIANGRVKTQAEVEQLVKTWR